MCVCVYIYLCVVELPFQAVCCGSMVGEGGEKSERREATSSSVLNKRFGTVT